MMFSLKSVEIALQDTVWIVGWQDGTWPPARFSEPQTDTGNDLRRLYAPAPCPRLAGSTADVAGPGDADAGRELAPYFVTQAQGKREPG
jgi:hypothetical protein